MSNSLQPYNPSPLVQRRVERELTRLTAQTGLAISMLDAKADVEAARASAVAVVGQRAMQEVALVTKLERDLTEAVPAAQARLVMIGDLTSMAVGQVVMNAAHKLAR